MSHSSDRKKLNVLLQLSVWPHSDVMFILGVSTANVMVGACNACGKIDAAQKGAAWSDHGTTKV